MVQKPKYSFVSYHLFKYYVYKREIRFESNVIFATVT